MSIPQQPNDWTRETLANYLIELRNYYADYGLHSGNVFTIVDNILFSVTGLEEAIIKFKGVDDAYKYLSDKLV